MPRLQEPLLVTTLRRQIRRGAPESLLARIAGGEAEYRRIVSLYELRPAQVARPTVRASERKLSRVAAEPKPLPAGQARLLSVLTDISEAGEDFPGALVLARLLDCSWAVIERDLRRLTAKRLIRTSSVQHGSKIVRRIEVLGSSVPTEIR